jgi:hypothetical protein
MLPRREPSDQLTPGNMLTALATGELQIKSAKVDCCIFIRLAKRKRNLKF